ncbi:MAG: lipid IV(A) 3-deoxy-D-manno-octulosonic acid transferase [bacterium]
MRHIYNLFLYLILPFLPLRLLWKSRKNIAYSQHIAQRFACFDFPALKDSIWVHAVSVGESISAVPLIQELIRDYPKTIIVVTTMTPTGAERIQKIFNGQVLQLYVPYDYPFAIKRFLRHINPRILILMETELWPNILYYSAESKIPIVLANARLSEKSFVNYKKIRFFVRSMLGCITVVAAQSKLDAERFLALGLDQKKILVTGNIKFDVKVPDELFEHAKQLRLAFGKNRPIWIAASTHKGEEEKILAAAKIVCEAIPESLLILVPRHPQRFDEVFDLCLEREFEAIRYSKNQNCLASTNVVLGDVMGQLLLFYAASNIAFVGGSLVSWGGHNLLEPAVLAKPIISGQHLSNFLEISQLLIDFEALITVVNEAELARNLILLFQNKTLQEKLGCLALDVVEKHRGATKKTLAHIKGFL